MCTHADSSHDEFRTANSETSSYGGFASSSGGGSQDLLCHRNKRVLSLALAVSFVLMALSPALSVSAVDVPSDLNVGPFVDHVVFKTAGPDAVLSMQAGEIDLMTGFVHGEQLPLLEADPDIAVFSALRNGYGHITINCRDYPLNISGFRRAFAYAFDKTRVTVEIMDGFSQEHDSLVPYTSSWCIEDEMPYHYYTSQSEIGNRILDDLGFEIDTVTGWRNAPDGTPFDVVIEYAASSPEVAGGTSQIGVDALNSLHVNAHTRASDFYEYMSRLDSHGNYDMIFYAFQFSYDEVDWLAYEYWSEYASTPYQNACNFANDSYDSWRDQLLHSTVYEEVYEASAQMQLILQENVPRLVVYMNTYFQPYRIDTFTGHVEDRGNYIAGMWTLRKIHRIDGGRGGTVNIASADPETFNIFLYSTTYASYIIRNLWPRLYFAGPDQKPWPDLAEGFVIQTHTDNPDVPVGHTRFIVDIIQNATWADGTPVTGEDVAFTFTYLLETAAYGNPTVIHDLEAAYAISPYRVVVEYNTESYWHVYDFLHLIIIPKHIFNDVDGIGYEGWNTWNPVFDPADPHVTCGPFTLTDVQLGEFYELTANPDFHYYPEYSVTDYTAFTGTNTGGAPFNAALALAAGTVSAAAVILVGSYALLRGKQR
jgi:ABC-type transport system substrate-binding protein